MRDGVRTPICAACRLPNDVTVALVSREAFRVTLDPTREQEELLRKHVGLSRFVYNWALARRMAWWDANKDKAKAERDPEPTSMTLSKIWTAEHPEWSGELARSTVTYALDAVDAAFSNFFRRIKLKMKPYGFPRFKKKGECRDSFTLQDQRFRAEPRAVKLGKIGMVRTHEYVVPTPGDEGSRGRSRYLEGRVLRIVISREHTKWVASLMVERERPAPAPRAVSVVGVDMGTGHMVTTSDGEQFPASPELDRMAKRMRKYQRRLERCERGSKNSERIKTQIAAMHGKVSDRRSNYIHSLANHLVDGYSVVVIENFDVRSLALRSGPTRGKRNASDARRKIMQAGFGELRRIVGYKARWRGASALLITGRTDQTCSKCLVVNEAMRERTDSKFTCPSCGHSSTRQDNTAQLLARIGRGEATGFTG